MATHRWELLQCGLEVVEKVLVELGVLCVLCLEAGGIEPGHLFGAWREIDGLAWEQD